MVQDRQQCWLGSSGFPPQKQPHLAGRTGGFSKLLCFPLGEGRLQLGQPGTADPLARLKTEKNYEHCT